MMNRPPDKIFLHWETTNVWWWYPRRQNDNDIEYIYFPQLVEGNYDLRQKNKDLQAENERLLNAVKLAYRKHHLDDRSVGWEELSDALFNTLCDAMGDIGFDEWLKKQRKGC